MVSESLTFVTVRPPGKPGMGELHGIQEPRERPGAEPPGEEIPTVTKSQLSTHTQGPG